MAEKRGKSHIRGYLLPILLLLALAAEPAVLSTFAIYFRPSEAAPACAGVPHTRLPAASTVMITLAIFFIIVLDTVDINPNGMRAF